MLAADKLESVAIDRFLARSEHLARLQEHPSWPAWEELLREMRQSFMESLAVEADVNEIRYWQGAAGAVGELLERPRRMIERAAEVQSNEEDEKRGIRPELRALVGMGVDSEGDF